jgi:hypothetical protein
MKFLKLFEDFDNTNAFNIKEGDFLLVNFDHKGGEEVIQVLSKPVKIDKTRFNFFGRVINNRGMTGYFYNDEIIKKLSRDEIEFYSTVKKYNL